MVQIQPVQIWNNGNIINAEFFDLTCINDNMTSQAIFYYKLLSIDLEFLSSGNEIIQNEDYKDYNSSTDSSTFAYNFIAAKLNLQILNNEQRTSIADNQE
jgi:hypothetical protein